MNIYNIGQEDKPRWFGWGQTKGPLMIKTHRIPRTGGDYNKARDAGVKYTELGFYENVDLTDHKIKQFVLKIPGINQVGTEAYECMEGYPINPEMVKDMVEKKFFIESVKEDLNLRTHQEKFVEKILFNWEQWTEFLLFAKCRGGKSIMTLSTIVDAGIKETLIVSRFNSPKQSWFNDCNKFRKFKNIRVVKLNDDNWEDEYKRWADDPDIHIIFWSTIQGLCVSKNIRLNKLNKLTSIELVVFDECHIGENADQFKKVRKKFVNAKCLKVSGTAYDQVLDYGPEHRFVYSYWDEQHYYRDKYPKMDVYTIAINVPGYREVFGNDPDAFTNIFLVNDDKTAFLYPDLVRNFWNKYFTTLG